MSIEFTEVKCRSHQELDALVAEKVMGGMHRLVPPGQIVEFEQVVPHYSTDIAAAWEVIEIIRQRGIEVIVGSLDSDKRYNPYGVTFEYPGANPRTATGATASIAICLAALRWQGIKVELAI